jgi:acetylornithine deacetylase/succinyl-diaminopimelate desuccinylase-like protein
MDQLATTVAANRAAAEALLAALVRVPSDNPPGDCAPHAAAAAPLLEGLGFTVERHPVPAAECAAVGMTSCTNLIIRRRFGSGGPTIALNAHGDVVPPGEGWSRDPYGAEVVEGRMYGRGVAVSKSDFATYTFALKALEASGLALNGTVELHFTYDEETGGEIGPRWLLANGISKPDLALSAGFSYAVTTAHNGVLHLEAVFQGRQAHAAMPHTGIDALEAATEALRSLYAERARLSGLTSATPGIGCPAVTVGRIAGGVNTNVVPDRIAFRLDRRITPEENPAEVEAGLRALIGAACRRVPGASVTVNRIMLARPLVATDASRALAERLCRHATAVFGVAVEPVGVPLYTDARHYAEAGVPVVLYGAGPRSILEANAHAADENLVLEDLSRATLVVARTLAEVLAA